MTKKSQYPRNAKTASEIRLPETAVRKERPGPAGGARDKNRQEKVARIVESALTVFLDRGIEATTIDEITKEAGVAKGSFYRYFDGKSELVAFLFRPLQDHIEGAFNGCASDLEVATDFDAMMASYESLGARLAGALLHHDRAVLLYLQENRGPGHGARAPVRALSTFVTDGALTLSAVAHRRGLLRPFPSTLSALSVVGAAERLIFALLTGADLGDPLEIPNTLATLILDGIAAPGLARARTKS